MVGVNFFLRQYGLLFENTGAVYGAGFTAVNVTLWMYRIIMVLSVIAAIGFAVGINKRRVKYVVTVPVADNHRPGRIGSRAAGSEPGRYS